MDETENLLDEAIIEFPRPFALKQRDDDGASAEKLGAVPPATFRGIGERDTLRIAAVPRILGHARNWRFGGSNKRMKLDLTPSFVTNSADAAIWHACQGGSLTMALSYQVTDHIRSGALCVVLEEFEPPPLPIQFVYASSRLLSLKVRAFMDMAVETCDWTFLDLGQRSAPKNRKIPKGISQSETPIPRKFLPQ